MSIENMYQRLASGETIQAVNPDNDLAFDVKPYPTVGLSGYQACDIYINGKHVNSACVPQVTIEEWACEINERKR